MCLQRVCPCLLFDITAHLLLQSPTCVAVMDTPQFQRLRDLHQLGATSFVFPGQLLQCSPAQQNCYLVKICQAALPMTTKLWQAAISLAQMTSSCWTQDADAAVDS